MKSSSRTARVAKRLLYRAIHAHRPVHPVTARCCGLLFHVASNCRIGEDLYANGFERLQRGILDQIISPGSTVLDIGANLGFYTCLFAKRVGSAGRVIAVEPTPKVFQSLQHNVVLNRMEDRVTSLCAALSDRQGVAKLNLFPEGNEVYNSIGATKSWQHESPESSIEVNTTTLDSLLAESPDDKSCFVKIDVEGFQHQVLQGGINRLREMHNLSLMIEMNDMASRQCGTSTEESLRLLDSCGFNPFITRDGESLTPLSDYKHIPGELNEDVFFFKKSPRLARAA
jgi:FkbM family methyltransferase